MSVATRNELCDDAKTHFDYRNLKLNTYRICFFLFRSPFRTTFPVIFHVHSEFDEFIFEFIIQTGGLAIVVLHIRSRDVYREFPHVHS